MSTANAAVSKEAAASNGNTGKEAPAPSAPDETAAAEASAPGDSARSLDEAARTKALAHYQKAVVEYRDQRYCVAAEDFAGSLEEIPLPVTALWSGRASLRCGKLMKAMAAYELAVRLAPNELWHGAKQQRAQAEAWDELELLKKRIPRIVVQAPSQDAERTHVFVDGTELAQTAYGTEYYVEPGAHLILYVHGSDAVERRIVAVEQQVQFVQFGVSASSESPALAAPAVHAGPPKEASRPRELVSRDSTVRKPPVVQSAPVRRYKTATVVATAIGSAGLAAGIVMRILAFNQKDKMDAHCDSSKACDEIGMDAVSKADALQTQSTIYFLIGIAGLGTGIGFAIAGAPKATNQARLTPVVSPAFAGLRLEQRF
jgi:tetratricopeptide (TPR) repeat protein